MDALREFVWQIWLDNYIWQYGAGILLIVFGLLLKSWFSRLISILLFKLLKKYKNYIEAQTFIELLQKPLSFTLLLIFIFLAFMQVDFPASWNIASREVFGLNMILYRSYMALLILSVFWVFLRILDFMGVIMTKKAEQKNNLHSVNQLIPFFVDGTKIVIMIFGLFFIFGSVFQVNVGTLVAGLGIGGLAIALAARESLENLIGSFTIFLDKPFVVGDFVKVNDIYGVVEKIGFRSTRLRTLEKSYVTLPNKKMVDQELDNLSLRTHRRAMFNIGVTYSTSIDQVKIILDDIQHFIDNHPKTNDEGRVHFTEFGASCLEIMVLFFVNTKEWGEYLKVKQEINFEIMKIVKKHNADFALPAQSIYIEKTS